MKKKIPNLRFTIEPFDGYMVGMIRIRCYTKIQKQNYFINLAPVI